MMTIGIPCIACENFCCGSCVADRSQSSGVIRNAKEHCSCSAKGHMNKKIMPKQGNSLFIPKKEKEPTPESKTKFFREYDE